MITKLTSYPILKWIRVQKCVDLGSFSEFITKISNLLQVAPEIAELDINPLLATDKEIIAVDARIRIEK